MGKIKQLTFASLLTIMALNLPCMTGVAQSDQFIGPGGSTSDSGHSPSDSMGITTRDNAVANGNNEDSLPSSSQMPADQSQPVGRDATGSTRSDSPPRWTVSAEAIILDKIGSTDRTLVSRVPGITPFNQVPNTTGAPALNASDFQGFAPGPKLGLIYNIDSGFGLELSYFHVIDWNITKAIGPDNPPDWLVMKAPGGFVQTQDFAYQSMAWDYSTDLYNAELNMRWNLSSRITLLAGFRWLQLTENLQGTIPPIDRIEPTWKFDTSHNLFYVQQIQYGPGIAVTAAFPPFSNTNTTNNLYGLQVGADGKMFERGRFSIGGVIKVGGYLNDAEQSTGVSIAKVVRPSQASTDQASFIGEAGLQCKYQVTKGLTLKVGYEAFFLTGIASAPGQIQETLSVAPATVRALGVNCGSSEFFQGPTVGVEYSF